MDHAFIYIVAAAFLALLAFKLIVARPRMPASQAFAAHKTGRAVIVDIREPAEWSSGVAQPAHLLPLSDLRGPRRKWQAFLEQNRDKQLLLYCHSGMRSASAAALLRREGFDAANIGSLHGWIHAGLPTRKPR